MYLIFFNARNLYSKYRQSVYWIYIANGSPDGKREKSPINTTDVTCVRCYTCDEVRKPIIENLVQNNPNFIIQ